MSFQSLCLINRLAQCTTQGVLSGYLITLFNLAFN